MKKSQNFNKRNEASEKKYKDLKVWFHEKSTKNNKEIWRLRDHNEKLLSQIKKSNVKKQRLKQENESSDKELKVNLSEKEKENLCLKTLDQKLLEQIKNLKDKEKDTKDKVNDSENDELSRLRNHNQALLMQIKKLKRDNKSLDDKLEQLQEVTQAEDKPTEVKTHAEVAVQMVDIPNDDSVANSITTTLDWNQETNTNMIRESLTRRTIYRHSNHKSRLSNQSAYQYHPEHKWQKYVPKNTEVWRIQSYNNYSSWIFRD